MVVVVIRASAGVGGSITGVRRSGMASRLATHKEEEGEVGELAVELTVELKELKEDTEEEEVEVEAEEEEVEVEDVEEGKE